ncbi:hypothetical protein K443DRAFT_98364 [Laccaria amethystina LaAM-08-1]|jgi:hypothetical protein|uniref:Uncharacterized protein n=1 Tax=Laccaria amethystina LaAM-08-1 TaxID=1095629 RepID=A0A0C9Y0M2_9AGAR|nr:hypothetical protein K443DRAFT_98364 [Laccaria amethystina LaAM-08-1]
MGESPRDTSIEILPSSELQSTLGQGFLSLQDPHCYGMQEVPSASQERKRVSAILRSRNENISQTGSSTLETAMIASSDAETSPLLFTHLAHGLAYTAGSALGSTPPSTESCLSAFLVPNSAKLTAGARAWSKHSHRSQPVDETEKDKRKRSTGWWGTPSGPVAIINERALALFWKVMDSATWKNLHWLPHQILVYEVRVAEGYGMRWSQDQSEEGRESEGLSKETRPWIFRGFVEPMMENGHEVGWKHPT